MTRPSLFAWFLLCFLGLVWGGSFVGIEVALTGFGPLTIAGLRIGLGAIVILGAAFVVGVGLPSWRSAVGRKTWLHAFGLGMLANTLPFALLSWGQQQVTSGFAGITMACVPLLVLPLAHFLVPGDRLTPRNAIGFALGFGGVVILIGPASILGGDSAALARLACIAAAGCYACSSIVTRRAPPGPLLSFSAAALSWAAAISLPLALALEGLPAAPSVGPLLGIAYLGLLPTALATLLLVHVIKVAGPSFLSLVNYQVPIWATLLGAVFLAEQVPPQMIVALALILVGMIVAQSKRRATAA